MKKAKFLLRFFSSDGNSQQFSTSFELPNSVNPAEFLSQVFPDYHVEVIDYSKNEIVLFSHGKEVR